MVYVTGDMHGDASRLKSSGMRCLKKGDTLLVCGDFGFVWDGSKAEQAMLKKLGKQKFNIAFVDGVHENFALLEQYPVVNWNGGRARQVSGNLFHLMRGELFTIEGNTYLAIGGGVCPDDDYRMHDDARMARETPSYEEMENAAANLQTTNGHVDYIITHEPPIRLKAFLQLKKQQHESVESTGLHNFFDEMLAKCTFKRWFFGSMHVDKRISASHMALFRRVVAVDQQD